MNFFIWKKNVSFSKYRDFCVFVKPADFKICGIISIAAWCKLHFFLLNPKSYQKKIWSNFSVLHDNISNTFLAECWRLETSSRPFYDFIKVTIQQDLAIFNSWHMPFLIVLYSPFQKMKYWNLDIWLLSNWGRLLN